LKQKASDENVFVPKEIKKQHLEKLAVYRRGLWEKPDLRTLFIEMTLNCNEHCRHCGSWCGDVKMEGTLSDEEILNMLEKLKGQLPRDEKGNIKYPYLNITGGEPLVRPGFVNLMKRITELGYRWGMTSNGLLINKSMAEDLKAAGLRTVSISLDGLRETHDWFRRSAGGYDKAIAAVKNLIEVGISSVMITTVVHKRNIDELDDIYKEVKKTGCNSWRIINVEPIGRAIGNKEIELERADYKRIIDFIIENRAKDTELDITFGCNHYLGPKKEREARRWYFLCTAGIYTAGIFYNGDIGACLDIERRPETIQGNIRNDDFYETWLNKFQIFRHDRTEESEKCKDCKHRRFCGGDGFHTWDIDNKEPRLCMFNEYKDEAKRAKKKKK